MFIVKDGSNMMKFGLDVVGDIRRISMFLLALRMTFVIPLSLIISYLIRTLSYPFSKDPHDS